MLEEGEAPDLKVGLLKGPHDPDLTPEERSLILAFSEHHRIPSGDLRIASLTDGTGERQAMVLVASLGVLRKLAAATGKLSGTDPPLFERDAMGLPAAATVRVRRTDLPRGIARTAFWHERFPRVEQGEPAGRWATEPDTMLAEVAEALALRLAFPSALEGVYTEGDLSDALKDRELGRIRAESEHRRLLEALR